MMVRRKKVGYHFICDQQDVVALRAILGAYFKNPRVTYVINSNKVHTGARIITIGEGYEHSLESINSPEGFKEMMQ